MLNATNQRLYDESPCELKAMIDKRMDAVQDGSDADTCFAVALFAIASASHKDMQRLDFIADCSQSIANIQLPRAIVEANLHSLRDAIDETIKLKHK